MSKKDFVKISIVGSPDDKNQYVVELEMFSDIKTLPSMIFSAMHKNDLLAESIMIASKAYQMSKFIENEQKINLN